MSAEIIILLACAGLILVALLDGVTSLGLMNARFRVLLGIIGFTLLIYGGFTFGTVAMPSQMETVAVGNKLEVEYPVQKVQVISPLEGDAVDCRSLTMGVYPEGHEKDIWVLLRPSDDRYYPQSDHTNTSYKRNGEWQVITRFGGSKDEKYDIIVYETDAEASKYFSTTIEDWKAALSYPGLKKEELPSGATEIDRIVVSLKDNCRGVF
ncbi:MAG: hypothetical protein AAF598_10510 [Bacteroidota bacterium]